MHIKELRIENIGCIKKLNLKFNEKFNIICGANGVGKTTILNVITNAFTPHDNTIKRHALSTIGRYFISISQKTGRTDDYATQVKIFSPDEIKESSYVLDGKDFVRFATNEGIHYKDLHCSKPPKILEIKREFNNNFFEGNITNWFANRLDSLKNYTLTANEFSNYLIALKSFRFFDSSLRFKMIDNKQNIIVTSINGDIYFKYLSSGYKNCIGIIIGLINEIEQHYLDDPIKIENFDGCVLIDEIEEHLHPTWQAQLVNALKEIFPKTQFIVTTHSPSILQTLDKNEIIPLYLDKNNQTAIKPLNLGDYGLQGWTLEEILKDVMGMPNTTSTLYSSTMEKFNKAMTEEDQEEILKQYRLLLQMLHPNNPLRRLLQIQVAEWEE